MLKTTLETLWDSDSDQELPNIIERIQKLCAQENEKNVKLLQRTSDNSGENELLKFSEKSCPEQKLVHTPGKSPVERNKICKSFKVPQDLPKRTNAQTNFKDANPPVTPLIMSSDSEDESEFLTFSERIRNTPKLKNSFKDANPPVTPLIMSSDGEDESEFLTFSERIGRNIPKLKDSSDIHITKSVPRNFPALKSDSEDEAEFLKYISERIRNTPHLKKNVCNSPCVTNDSDDEVFSKLTDLWPPKSKNRGTISNPDFPEKKKLFSSPTVSKESDLSTGLTISKSWTAVQRANAEEYSKLFLCNTKVSKYFTRYREDITNQLFSFFNKKVFDSQLPKDIRICWKNRLNSTAGMFFASKTSEYFIYLSASILTSFDRLQDTLIHEMCHAAVTIISKRRRENHGPLWQVWGSRCGLVLPFIECPSRCHNYEINYTVWYSCKNCNWRVGRLRQSSKCNEVCKYCNGPITVETTKVNKKSY